MGAINFDQPSTGQVTSDSSAFTVTFDYTDPGRDAEGRHAAIIANGRDTPTDPDLPHPVSACGVIANGADLGIDATGSRAGVRATSTNIGVIARGTSGDGVGVSATGGRLGVSAKGDKGVYGFGHNSGVNGYSDSGYGGDFSAPEGLAPLILRPSTIQGPPASGTHNMGELYVDSQGVLYFCTADGTPANPVGTWKIVTLT